MGIRMTAYIHAAGSLLSTLPGHLYSNQSCAFALAARCLHFPDIRVVEQLFLGWRRRNYKGFQVDQRKTS